ncbi:MAG: hypothetical protein OXU23_24350, partial [Candidatus Poribacteria bacterium]|nr:hypothetical protein [Candidatus Poribacteria bacterium]
MKSQKWKIVSTLLVILCILFGIASGIYFEFAGESADNEENATNWKRGFFRLTLVLSFIVSILGGTFFASLAKKGKLADEDDGDPPSKVFTVPKFAFLVYFVWFLIFVWLAYFIIQWPVYY